MFDKKQGSPMAANANSAAQQKPIKQFGKPLGQKSPQGGAGKSFRNSVQVNRQNIANRRPSPNIGRRIKISDTARNQKSQGNVASKNLRITPIGGNEEVGRNMTMFEYDGDIIILDMGMMFPEEDMPGIDYIVPNTSYLKGKEKNVRGVIFSHGHLDHIGAAPILLKELGYPPIVGRDLTLALIKKKLEDFDKNSAQNLKIMRINIFV